PPPLAEEVAGDWAAAVEGRRNFDGRPPGYARFCRASLMSNAGHVWRFASPDRLMTRGEEQDARSLREMTDAGGHLRCRTPGLVALIAQMILELHFLLRA